MNRRNKAKRILSVILILMLVIQACVPSMSVFAEGSTKNPVSEITAATAEKKETAEGNGTLESTEATESSEVKKPPVSEEAESQKKEQQKSSSEENPEIQKGNLPNGEDNKTDPSTEKKKEAFSESSSEEKQVSDDNKALEDTEEITKADYLEKEEISAADVQGKASEDEKTAQNELSSLRSVPKKGLKNIAGNLLSAPGKSAPSPVLIEGLERSGDGSNIESIIAKWITADTVDNNDDSLLYIKPEGDTKQNVVLQINYALSGEHNYEPGDILITIPKNIFFGRDGKEAGSILIPYAESPSMKNDFNWEQKGNSYVLTNTKKMSAATKGYIQFAFLDLIPSQLIDMKVSETFDASIEVTTHAGNVIGLKSNTLTAQFDTEARVTDVRKYVSGRPTRVSADSIPEEQRINGEEEYILVKWYVYGEITANTMYTLTATDTIPDEYNGFIVKGSEKLRDEKELYHGTRSGRSAYYQYSTAYPASQFEPNVLYTFHNDIRFTVLEDDPAAEVVNGNVSDEDPRLQTEKSASAQTDFRYTLPVWVNPTGHFMVVKNGNDDSEKNNVTHKSSSERNDLHLWSSNNSGWYGIYPSALNELQDEYKEHGAEGGIRLSYTVNSVGYLMPSMFDSDSFLKDGEIASRKSINYNRPVSLTTKDEGISISRDGDKLVVGTDYDYLGIEFPNTPWVYTGEPQNINPDGSWKALTAGDGTFKYVRDNDPSHIPDIVLEVQGQDERWVKTATASWKTGTRVITPENGISVDGAFVAVPEGIKNFRTRVLMQNTSTDTEANTALQAAIDYDVRPVIKLYSTKRMNRLIKGMFELSNTPSTQVWNEANMIAEREDDLKPEEEKQIVTINNSGYDSLRGYTTDISVYPYKSSSQTLKEVDYENEKVIIHYSARVEERSLIHDRKTYEQAVSDRRLLSETHGIWRDLLPKGVTPVKETIKLRNGDRILDIYTKENYKNSGRTLLIVEAELKNSPERYRSDDIYYYEDVPRITFDAVYDFTSLTDYNKTIHNVISFESSNPYIGTVDGYSGEPDDPYSANNVSTDDAFADEAEQSAMKDLDAERDDPSFVYAGATTHIDIISAARTSLSKDVMTNNDGWWSDGLYYDNADANKRTVYEGGQYSYRLRMMSDSETISKDLILFDSLENFYAGGGNDPIDVNASRWQGTLRRVDVSQLKDAGCAPVVYYSTKENLQISDENDPNQANATNTNLASSVWIKAEDYTGPLSAVRAVAVDASKKADGSDFILQPNESVVVLINMLAPSGQDARTYISQKGIWGDSAHAYNNTYLLCTSIDATTHHADSDNFVRKDYTKVGLMEHSVSVEKVWDDDNNRDGKRPASVTMRLFADGKDTGQTVVLPQQVTDPDSGNTVIESWKGSFKNIPYTDPEGNKIHYSVREDAVSGYEAEISETENVYLITNTHEPERITISGEKIWTGDEPENRPSYITVDLYANGELLKHQKVYPNIQGKWNYSFSGLYKYENGHEIEYTVKEANDDEAANSYLSETDGYNIRNTYHPYGDLEVKKTVINATPSAGDKVFPFTFEFTKDNKPVFDSFDYDVYEGETKISSGEIATNGTIALKGGQCAKIREIGEGIRYSVTEESLPGFRLTSSENTSGRILPNETVTASFENTYSAKGQVKLQATKRLNNREVPRYSFFFSLCSVVAGEGERLLRSASNGRADTIVRRADGTIDYSTAPVSFPVLKYTEEDVGKTFIYRLRETDRGFSYIDFDDTAYTAEVTVSDPNGDGTLDVSVLYKKNNEPVPSEDVLFTNDYHASGSADLKAWKTLTGRDLKANEFSFELCDASRNVLQTKKNNSKTDGGDIDFNPISFDEKDIGKTFYYISREVIPEDAAAYTCTNGKYDKAEPEITYRNATAEQKKAYFWGDAGYDQQNKTGGVIYDPAESAYAITVHDNGNGTLSFSQSAVIKDVCSWELYKVSGETKEPVIDTETGLTKVIQNEAWSLPVLTEEMGLEQGTYILKEVTDAGSVREAKEIEYELQNENGFQAKAVNGTLPVFNNKLIGGKLKVTKTITGGDSGKEFHFKVKLFNQDGEKLNGNFSYDAEEVKTFATIDKSKMQSVVTNDIVSFQPNTTISREEIQSLISAKTAKKVDDGTTEYSVYMWKDGKNVYWWSDAMVTYLPKDSSRLFYNRDRLVTLDLSNLNTSNVTNMNRMFYNCQRLNSLDVSGLDTSKVTNMFGMFEKCSRLTSMDISDWDTSNVTSMEGMFSGCSGLVDLEISGLDTSHVMSMRSMFSGCNGLTSLDISDLDTTCVTDMAFMFYNCSNLSSLDASACNTACVTNMNSMFYGCSSLISPDLSEWDTSNVTDMSYMFNNCNKLSNLDTSDWNTSNVTSMKYMFSNCSSLTDLDVSAWNTSNVTGMSSMFYNCKKK